MKTFIISAFVFCLFPFALKSQDTLGQITQMPIREVTCIGDVVNFSIPNPTGFWNLDWTVSHNMEKLSETDSTLTARIESVGAWAVNITAIDTSNTTFQSRAEFGVTDPLIFYSTNLVCPQKFPLDIDGVIFDSLGIFSHQFISQQAGCDSTVVYELIPREVPIISIDTLLCPGQSLNIHGINFQGINSDTILIPSLSQFGCDSFLHIDSFVADTSQKVISCVADNFLNALSFSWETYFGADEYEIFINNQSVGFQKGTAYLHLPNTSKEIVNIRVIPKNKELCNFAEISLTCEGPILTNLEENSLEKNIKISPNPSKGIFEIESQFLIKKVSVFDLFGKFLFETSDTKIDLSKHDSGVYFLKINSDEASFVKKVLKQN